MPFWGIEKPKKEYEKIKVFVENGQVEKIRNHAKSKGLTLNSYIRKLIQEDMHEEQIKGIPVEKLSIEELDLSTLSAGMTINTLRLKNIDEIEKLIDVFGEERFKEMLRLNQEAYDELIQRIKDFQ